MKKIYAHPRPVPIHDVNILDDIIPEVGAFYIMDCGYPDFTGLYIFHQCLALFVTWAKGNFQFRRLSVTLFEKMSILQVLMEAG